MLVVALASWLVASPAAPEAKPTPPPRGFRLHRTIPLPGDEAWDSLAADPETARVYVTRGDRLVAVDLATEKVVGEITGTAMRGIALAHDLKRGFVAEGGEGVVTVFGLPTLGVQATVSVGGSPGALLYDSFSKRVFALDAAAGRAVAIEGADGRVAGSLDLGGPSRSAVADGKGTVFAAVTDTSEVVAFGSGDLKVRSRWALAPCEGPAGLALDRAKGRLFVGCRSQVMAILDTSSGSVTATLPIGKGVDGVGFDDVKRLAFAANDDGILTVVGEDATGHPVVVESATTLPGARTLALDPKARRIYLAAARFSSSPPGTADKPRARGPMVPGTFVILVMGR